MGLIEVIKEQTDFGFTGKINILSKNSQYLGAIFLKDGIIVNASYESQTGERSLKKAIFEDLESRDQFKFVVEPEIVADEKIIFELSFEKLNEQVAKEYSQYQQVKKLKPPVNLDLIISPEIITNEFEITATEFRVLEVISEFSKVADIYANCNLLENEITLALVELRKKRAIRVFQSAKSM